MPEYPNTFAQILADSQIQGRGGAVAPPAPCLCRNVLCYESFRQIQTQIFIHLFFFSHSAFGSNKVSDSACYLNARIARSSTDQCSYLIVGTAPRERITPGLIDLHWLPIKARIVFKICVLIYTALNTGKPAYLRNKLSKFTTELGVSIRYSHDPHRLNEPRMNKEIGTRSFKYSAPRLFNSLPRSVKDSGNLNVFKKRLKTFLFSECYDLDTKTITDRYHI